MQHLTINFNESAIYTKNKPPNKQVKEYWYYEEGYFYYSKVLLPNERTKLLLNSIVANEDTPNKYKGVLYQLVPVMNAHDRTLSLLSDWNISKNSPIYKLYQELLH